MTENRNMPMANMALEDFWRTGITEQEFEAIFDRISGEPLPERVKRWLEAGEGDPYAKEWVRCLTADRSSEFAVLLMDGEVSRRALETHWKALQRGDWDDFLEALGQKPAVIRIFGYELLGCRAEGKIYLLHRSIAHHMLYDLGLPDPFEFHWEDPVIYQVPAPDFRTADARLTVY